MKVKLGKKQRLTDEMVRKLQRNVKMWDMRCEGRSISEIAQDLSMNAGTVASTLRNMARQLVERVKEDMESQRITRIRQLDYLLAEATQSWRDSKKKNADGMGNPKFLSEAREALAQICKVGGLITQTQIPANGDPNESTAIAAATGAITALLAEAQGFLGRGSGPQSLDRTGVPDQSDGNGALYPRLVLPSTVVDALPRQPPDGGTPI